MTDVFAIAQIFIDHIKATCPDDVCIVAAYGSYLHGNPSKYSDLDLYYIPEPGKGDQLYRSFVAFDLPFEFWGVSWEFAEKIAAGKHHWSIAPAIITQTRVLHARSEADLQRFLNLQQQVAQLQQPDSQPAAIKLALDAFNQALCRLAALEQVSDAGDLTAARWAGCNFIDELLDCLCLLNQTHLTRYWASDVSQLAALAVQPPHLQARLTQLVTAGDAQVVFGIAGDLLQETRALLLAAQRRVAQPEPAVTVLRDYYMAIKEYVNKVVSACDNSNLTSAAFVATKMQVELAGLLSRVRDGIDPNWAHGYADISAGLRKAGLPDFTEAVTQGDFDAMRRLALNFDAQARVLFAQHGVALNEFDNAASLHQYLCRS
jgi:hypothetical protein